MGDAMGSNLMDKNQIAVTAIALMRDSVHSEVELLGADFKKLIEPVMELLTSKDVSFDDESKEVFRAAFEGLARKMIDFVDAISETERMADSALEGLGFGSVQIQALTADTKEGKIVSVPIGKSKKSFDAGKKGYRKFDA